MESDPTVSYLVSAGVISNANVEATVETYLTAPDQGFVPLGMGYQVDIAAAIAAHAYATKVLKTKVPGRNATRTAVRRSTLTARTLPR
jgi:hypothetical protein